MKKFFIILVIVFLAGTSVAFSYDNAVVKAFGMGQPEYEETIQIAVTEDLQKTADIRFLGLPRETKTVMADSCFTRNTRGVSLCVFFGQNQTE